jgi:DNA primase
LALATHDLDKPDGRARAFAQLKGVLSEAATPIERDEELRYIAERLGLSKDNLASLLQGTTVVRAAAGGRRGEGQTAPAGPAPPMLGHELEVRFLAGCLARPDKGRAVLAGVDEGYFATAETRAALRVVKTRLDADDAGNTLQTAENSGAGDDAGEVLAEVVVRAGRERFTEAVVDELFLRLQEAQVGRLIARLKLAAEADDTGTQGRKLAELEAVRRRLREAIRAVPVDDEPDEG